MVKEIFALSLLTCCYSCSENKQLSEQEMREVSDQFHAKLELAMPAKNLESILELYEERAIYLPLSGPVLKGKENIRKGYEKTFSNNVTSFEMDRIELSGDSQFLIEVGIINAELQASRQGCLSNFRE